MLARPYSLLLAKKKKETVPYSLLLAKKKKKKETVPQTWVL